MSDVSPASAHDDLRRVRISLRRPVSTTVMEFVLEAADGGELAPWEPGAHIDLRLPDGTERQFSLAGDPRDLSSYRIGVLREPAGRGGSAWMHDEGVVGAELDLRGPRNNFSLEAADSYYFVAGGVGITPLLPMVRRLADDGAQWRLTYLGRSRASMAFLDELEPYGDRVEVRPSDEFGPWELAEALAAHRTGHAVYACGPERLLTAVEESTRSWAPGAVHLERFAPKDPELLEDEGGAFEVELAQSGQTLQVSAGESILSVVESAGVFVPSSCREGTCGTCETPIISGEAEHRDSILSPEEQAENEVMMICVSRATCPRLVLDL